MTDSKFIQISKDSFKKHMQDVCYLIGYPEPPEQQLRLFFQKVQSYDLRDFKLACDDNELLKELSRRRNLCWPVLQETIEKYQARRCEVELKAQKKVEKFEDREITPEIRKMIDEILSK